MSNQDWVSNIRLCCIDHVCPIRMRFCQRPTPGHVTMTSIRFWSSLRANVIGQFLTIAGQLVQIPLFLAFWPKNYFGEWIVISAIPTMMSFADGGFGMLAGNEAAMAAGAGDWQKAQSTVSRNLYLQIIIIGISVFLLSAAYWVIDLSKVLAIARIGRVEVYVCSVLLTCSVLSMIPSSLILGIYRAEGKDARCAMAVNLMRLTSLVSISVALYLGSQAIGIAAVTLLVNLGGLMLLIRDARTQCRLRLVPERITAADVRRSLLPALAHQMIPLGNGLYFQGQTILVNAVMGPATVVVFNIGRLVSRVIAQVAMTLKNSAWPEIALMRNRARAADMRRLLQRVSRINLLVCIPLAALLLIAGPTFVEIWTHQKVSISRLVLGGFVTAAVLSAVSAVPTGFLQAVNRHELYAAVYCAVSLLALGMSWVLRDSGLSGVIASMIMAELVMLFVVIQQTREELRKMPA